MIRYITILIGLFFTGTTLIAQDWATIPDFPEELGDVNWYRSYTKAVSQAKARTKPVFILFQEVPGCSTCRNYGNDLLTHPLVVEAIETHFVPLVIYNNMGGLDAEILRKFDEPSWNNPVSRIIDPNSEKDITKRLSGRYDMAHLVSFISNGILESGKLIPEYLDLLYQEVASSDLRETHLSMYCFWSGEKNLGALDGVVATKAGFMNGTEVVKVKYDASKVSEEKLIQYASKKQCADAIYTNDRREEKAAQKFKIKTKREGEFRPDGEPKYYIYKSDYRYLPMTSLQALKVNTALSRQLSPDEYLSPRQLELLELIKDGKVKKENVIDQNFSKSWHSTLSASR
jgi:copper chaperone CopZ